MMRYLAAAGSAILLVVAGVFLWRDEAGGEVLPPAPAPALQSGVAEDDPLPEPPQANERTREQRRFDRYDRDRDDLITREEYLRSRRTAFGKLDTNGDGRLSFEEWAVKTTTKFATADSNRSGSLDRREFATTRVVRKAPTRTQTAAKCICAGQADGDD